MAHWDPGRVIRPKEFVDSRIKRFFNEYHVAWVIAQHHSYIYIKIAYKTREDIIVRIAKKQIGKYFDEQTFHEDMPYVNGPFRDIRIFPDEFFSDLAPEAPGAP